MFQGVIFDLDGTLLDSMPVWETVDQRFLRENGIEPPADISETVKTMSIYDAACLFVNRFSLPMSPQAVIDRIEAIAAEAYAHTIPLKPGVAPLLDALDRLGIPCCIATATYNSLVQSALCRLGVAARFRFVITCTDVGEGKTSPLIFERAMERLGCSDPAAVLVVEDSLHCIETAHAAGFVTAGIREETAAADWENICSICDRSFPDLDGLRHWLEGAKA